MEFVIRCEFQSSTSIDFAFPVSNEFARRWYISEKRIALAATLARKKCAVHT